MAVDRHAEGEPRNLTPEDIFAMRLEVDMAARHVFGWPYEQGMVPMFAVAKMFDDNSAYAEFAIDASLDQKQLLHVPYRATLTYGEIVEPIIESIAPPGYGMIKGTEYVFDLQSDAITRNIVHGWYNHTQGAYAVGLSSLHASRQIKGFSPSQLHESLTATPTQADIEPIYKVLGAFSFSE
jgi:hypothetical protein